MNNRIIFLILLMIVLFFVSLSYKIYFVNKNYLIFTEIECNPLLESCFVGYCDSDYEECSQIEQENIFYYKKIQRLANFTPLCDPENEGCLATTCGINEPKCKEILCNPEDGTLDCSSLNNYYGL